MCEQDQKKAVESPESGKEKLRDCYNDWSEAVAKYSIQAAYAIIAANWAVHGRVNVFIGNIWATWSIALCIVLISFNIVVVWWMAELSRKRWYKAEKQQEWWKEEFQKRNKTKWPYSWGIETLALIHRFAKMILPLIAGLFFLVSLFP